MTDEQKTSSEPSRSGARPLDFSTFLLSLGTSALVQLGEAPDPTTGNSPPADPAAARQTIDLLGLLQDKTEGNLEDGEDKLLRNLLRDLRLHYVNKFGGD
ncbi:MAG: DUF1844 domain-containing protein [Myxococcota bacterium]|nr:DUF1844 domain-containing protein [Myxococcota bacterium]